MALTRINNQALTNITSAGLPSGTVLQVVNNSITASEGTTSSTFSDTSLTATITPTSTSSKILIITNISMYSYGSSNQASATVYRGTSSSGTNLGHSSYGFGASANSAGNGKGNISVSYLDSPATTSAQQYTVAIAATDNSNNAYISINNDTSTITLMEIAG